MKFILILFLALSLNGCTKIIEDATQNGLKGDWNLVSIKDVESSKTTTISELSLSTKIFDNRAGNALFLDGTNFNIYYQLEGQTSEIDGAYDSDINTLFLTFNDNKKIIRKINSISETEMTLEDTIASKAKLLNFAK